MYISNLLVLITKVQYVYWVVQTATLNVFQVQS
jgi:hypothetical protein